MSASNDQDPSSKGEWGKFKDKLKDYWKKATEESNVESMYNFAKTNTRDTIAYILLLTGLLLLFFSPGYGGILIGVIFGLYFSQELFDAFKNYDQFIHIHGFVKTLVFGALLLAFFISAPFIFLGAAAAVALRQLI